MVWRVAIGSKQWCGIAGWVSYYTNACCSKLDVFKNVVALIWFFWSNVVEIVCLMIHPQIKAFQNVSC
jgi:hypothetical protein